MLSYFILFSLIYLFRILLLNLLFLHWNSLLCRLWHLIICFEKLIVWIALRLLIGSIQITIIFLFVEQP